MIHRINAGNSLAGIKFGIQNGLNVARAGYSEDQILTACILAVF